MYPSHNATNAALNQLTVSLALTSINGVCLPVDGGLSARCL
ncbi:MAG: hypothetical protein ABW004_07225 [Aeromicrobium sp.]